MKELKLNLDETGYVNSPNGILFAEGLSTQAKLIYCFIRKFSEQSKTCFASNAYLQRLCTNQKGPMSASMVNGYLQELEKQKLITRGMKNSKRILYAHNWSDRQYTVIQPAELQTVDCIAADSLPSTTIQPAVHTIDSLPSRYNTVQTTEQNTVVYTNEVTTFVDNDVKEKLNKVMMNKETKDKFMDLIISCKYRSGGDGYKELLSELTVEELKQVENYMKENNKKDDFKESLIELLQNKSYVKQKQI